MAERESTWESWYKYTGTPYPAALNSLLLLATPQVSPATPSPVSVVQRASSSRFVNALSRPKYLGPSSRTALLFGAAQALGAWMVYDGDVESGSGFLAAWSALYLIVGGRGSVKALRYGKVWPLLVASVTGANAFMYGRRFIAGGFT
ncbi:hypothetical protein HG536_0A02210 [Torulaspora globosa]|uniref:Uncharacterized protein n=1 Tax=Torulaspora globosa TaxID=48254 RepID=A0A7G3ZA68_9SACH|nr:uncharacterized protein HG536_0A02210 [Torulaspora globosa]QLL30404.1 hypothetical protein HG536_0A02210 [Torulaspora globosa]